MTLLHRPRWRAGAALVALAAILALSLTVPMPSLPDSARAAVIDEIRSRLPGWTVERVERSWEGAYTVVTMCAGRQVGFQFVPGHGLPPDDAWIQPNDPFSRDRLRKVSDHWRYLVWYADPMMTNTLSCQEEIAGGRRTSADSGAFD